MVKRGIILSLDVLAAVALLAVFLTMISFEMNMPQKTTWLAKLGEDFLTVMDKGGILFNITGQGDSTALATMQTYLDKLPANVGANFTVKIYNCVEGSTTLSKDFNKLRGNATFNKVSVRRIFTNPPASKCGLAVLEVWTNA